MARPSASRPRARAGAASTPRGSRCPDPCGRGRRARTCAQSLTTLSSHRPADPSCGCRLRCCFLRLRRLLRRPPLLWRAPRPQSAAFQCTGRRRPSTSKPAQSRRPEGWSRTVARSQTPACRQIRAAARRRRRSSRRRLPPLPSLRPPPTPRLAHPRRHRPPRRSPPHYARPRSPRGAPRPGPGRQLPAALAVRPRRQHRWGRLLRRSPRPPRPRVPRQRARP
mmetsp:Transcript_17107/g.43952  ORF Transcript_17107/g.43952 Transcript_17107/m.43952 type:complete len:223 (+) Transcript_17107:648-1316(+)